MLTIENMAAYVADEVTEILRRIPPEYGLPRSIKSSKVLKMATPDEIKDYFWSFIRTSERRKEQNVQILRKAGLPCSLSELRA